MGLAMNGALAVSDQSLFGGTDLKLFDFTDNSTCNRILLNLLGALV
jgi:hypothetical protein